MSIKINEVDLKTVFIDPSLESSAGDGSTAALALNNLPETFEDNTCYIMRRTDEQHKCRLFPQQTAFTNIALLGMPRKENTKYWKAVDEATRLAWGSDSAKYAVVEAFTPDNSFHAYDNNNFSSIKSTVIKTFTMLNCHVSRSTNIYRVTSTPYGFNTIFILRNAQAVVNIHGCKFNYFGMNTEDEAYRNDPRLPVQNSTYYYTCRGDGYGYFSCNILNMTGNVINWFNDMHANGSMYLDNLPNVVHNAFYIENCERAIFNQNEVNKSSNWENKNFPAINFNFVNHLSCYNNKFYFVSGGVNSRNYYSAIFYAKSGYSTVCGNYCSYRMFKNQVYNVTSGSPFFWFGQVSGLNFCYNTADYGTSSEPAPCLIYVTTLGDGMSGLLKPEFKYNNITGCPEPSARTTTTAMYFQNIYPLTTEGNYKFAENYLRPNLTSRLIIENCVINCPHGTAIQNEYGIQVKNCDVTGLIKLNKCASIDLNTYKNYQANTCGITLAGIQNYVRIRDFWVDKESTYYPYSAGPQISSKPDSQNMVFVDKSNCDLNNTDRTTSLLHISQRCAYICPNKGKAGQYWHISANAVCESYNVYREGSTAMASLKFINNKTDNPAYPLIIGNEPVKGILLTPTATGKQILKAHVAWKNFSAAVNESKYNERFVLEIYVPYQNDQGEIVRKVYFSDIDGYWEDDSQVTWVNDTDLTKKSINVPVDVKITTEPIEVKVYHTWFDPTGFVYFDPNLEITIES